MNRLTAGKNSPGNSHTTGYTYLSDRCNRRRPVLNLSLETAPMIELALGDKNNPMPIPKANQPWQYLNLGCSRTQMAECKKVQADKRNTC